MKSQKKIKGQQNGKFAKRHQATETGLTRRDFMGAAAAVAAFTIVPRHVLGGAGYKPPSETLHIGAVGAGGRGRADISGVSTEKIVAMCDVDRERAAHMFNRYPKAKKYSDFRRMLEKEKGIDAVTVSTPDNVHAVATMMAVKMGKHVYTQKPMAHDIYEARKLTEAAREAKVITQMGNQAHSSEDIRLVCEWIRDGAIGPVREVHVWTDRPAGYWPQGIDRPEEVEPIPTTLDWNMWLGPAPKRPYNSAYCPRKWRGWWDFGCGALGDMGCHIIDVPFWALKLGHPTSVEASSTKVNSETAPLASIVHYDFPEREGMPPVRMTWYDGGLTPARPEELEPGRRMGNEDGGVLFIGDKGVLMSGHNGESPRLIPETKMREYKRPPKTIPRVKGNHHKDWLRACKSGKPACSNFDYAGPLTEVVLLGNVAIRTGEKLYWDGPNMKVTNVDKANEYIRREYRQRWSL